MHFRNQWMFLSNFYPCEILDEGVSYLNVEAAYQAAKIRDPKFRAAFSHLSGGRAKSIIKAFRPSVLDGQWKDKRLRVMRRLLLNKFKPGTDLADRLVATGHTGLVEENDWGDVFWGQCGGVGENWLGVLLMEIRRGLQKGKKV